MRYLDIVESIMIPGQGDVVTSAERALVSSSGPAAGRRLLVNHDIFGADVQVCSADDVLVSAAAAAGSSAAVCRVVDLRGGLGSGRRLLSRCRRATSDVEPTSMPLDGSVPGDTTSVATAPDSAHPVHALTFGNEKTSLNN